MDKNIAALLRQDARTIHVVFNMDDALENHLDVDLVWPAGADANMIAEAKRKIVANKSPAFRVKPGVKQYTYVTHLDIAIGDTVIVEAAGQPKLVKVVRVDSEVKIEPNDTVEYGWVIQKVDMPAYIANRERNAQIESAVAEAMRNNLRRGFAQSVIAAIGDETARNNLTALIGAPTATDLG
jgi:hypothetical protein